MQNLAPTNVENALREAVHRYVFRDLPGALRSVEYNESRVAFRLDEENDAAALRNVRRVMQLSPPPARVLEVGCGTGGWTAALARAGYDVAGLDPDEHGIRACEMRALRYPDTRQEYRVARGEAIPWPDAWFDVVVSNQVVEHVPGREAFVRECLRVLRPGGATLHVMPNYAFPWEPHYRIPFPPRPSRPVARAWLRLARRDTRLFDEEIFPTIPAAVLRAFSAAGFADVRNTYADEVAAKFDQARFTRPGLTAAAAALRRAGVLGLARRVVLALALYP